MLIIIWLNDIYFEVNDSSTDFDDPPNETYNLEWQHPFPLVNYRPISSVLVIGGERLVWCEVKKRVTVKTFLRLGAHRRRFHATQRVHVVRPVFILFQKTGFLWIRENKRNINYYYSLEQRWRRGNVHLAVNKHPTFTTKSVWRLLLRKTHNNRSA